MRARRRSRTTVAIIAALAIGAAALIAWFAGNALTQAAWADRAHLRGNVGGDAFELALLDDEARIQRVARDHESAVLEFAPVENAVPGSTVKLPLTLANNSPFSVSPKLTLAASSDDIASLESLVRVSVVERDSCSGDGSALTLTGDPEHPAKGTPLPELATGIVGTVMPPRSGTAQSPGASYAGGDAACRSYTALIHLLDDSTLRSLQGGAFTLTADIEGRTAE